MRPQPLAAFEVDAKFSIAKAYGMEATSISELQGLSISGDILPLLLQVLCHLITIFITILFYKYPCYFYYYYYFDIPLMSRFP